MLNRSREGLERRSAEHEELMIPAAEAFDGRGAGSGIATRVGTWPPGAVAVAVAALGYVVLAILLIGTGMILTRLLMPGPVGAWDNGVNEWFAARRTPAWDSLTDYASILAGTGTVLVIAGATSLILAFRRLWREIGFLLIGLFLEFTVFLTTALVIARPRPTVVKLDGVPATSSFPSGHVAAAIVLYAGLAILISSHTRLLVIRLLVWTIAVTFVIGVGISRVYRGLHHPVDVFASVILGVGALLFAILAIRAVDLVSHRRHQAITAPNEPQVSQVQS
jgi:membrane-associated phospholipid phosphatase